MYLLMILFITVVAPFLVMPRYITKGGRNPYDVVLISVITICAAAAVIFMGASMVGDGVLSQLHGSVEEISKAAAAGSNGHQSAETGVARHGRTGQASDGSLR